MFPNGDGSEIRGLSKLTADYAIIHHGSKQRTKGGVTETASEEVQEENGINIDGEKMQEEEVPYGNITCQLLIEQTPNDLDEDDKNGIEQIATD